MIAIEATTKNKVGFDTICIVSISISNKSIKGYCLGFGWREQVRF